MVSCPGGAGHGDCARARVRARGVGSTTVVKPILRKAKGAKKMAAKRASSRSGAPKKPAPKKRAACKAPAKKRNMVKARAGTRLAASEVPIPTGGPVVPAKPDPARARKILAGLKRTYGPVTCALHHQSALELLVATILSAQSTDQNVNRITPGLFAKYRSPADYAAVSAKELEGDIHSAGFFRQKAKSLQGACRVMIERFGGQVPDTMEQLLELPGVARKTANVVLGTWFGKNEGVVVDTHVGRLAQRMGLTWQSRNDKDAVKIEADLMELVPRREWSYFSHAMIRHGRTVCRARRPDCESCTLSRWCPSAGAFD